MLFSAFFIKQTKKPAVYDLIDIPDDQLTPDQMSTKKRQRMLKNAREGRLRAQAIQREKQQKVRGYIYLYYVLYR